LEGSKTLNVHVVVTRTSSQKNRSWHPRFNTRKGSML